MDYLECMAIHQTGKGKFFLHVFALVLSLNCYTLNLGLSEFSNRINWNGNLFYNTEHARDKNEMLLPDVHPSEIRDTRLESAPVVLEDGLALDPHVLAYDLAGGFFVHPQARSPDRIHTNY